MGFISENTFIGQLSIVMFPLIPLYYSRLFPSMLCRRLSNTFVQGHTFIVLKATAAVGLDTDTAQ